MLLLRSVGRAIARVTHSARSSQSTASIAGSTIVSFLRFTTFAKMLACDRFSEPIEHPMRWLLPILTLMFLAACGLTWLFRRAGTARVPFNDLRNKRNPRYAAFFKRYLDTFRQVFAERAATRQRAASTGVRAAERTPAASVAGS